VLGRYKDHGRTVERGFRFLKDPLFFTGSTFLKRPEWVMALGMVMALALLVYALGEWALRRGLAETGSSLSDQLERGGCGTWASPCQRGGQLRGGLGSAGLTSAR
jgi:transposase